MNTCTSLSNTQDYEADPDGHIESNGAVLLDSPRILWKNGGLQICSAMFPLAD